MISGIFHQGSGLGNQLFRYLAVRCLALDKGYEWGMMNPENFKGHFFKDFDFGKPINDPFDNSFIEERVNNPQGIDIRPYDKRIKDIKDNTLIDGEFQDPKYFMHHIDEIREWLKCEPQTFNIPFVGQEDICVLNIRGGEYCGVDDLFLKKDYWEKAMENMRKIRPNMRFGIVTDDIALAQSTFPNFPIKHEIQYDWACINNAQYLILSNSSFAILPALLNKNAKMIIAPKYWARHNVSDGYWALEQNKYPQFTYQDRDGNLHTL